MRKLRDLLNRDDIAWVRAMFEVRKQEYADHLNLLVERPFASKEEQDAYQKQFFRPKPELGLRRIDIIVWALCYFWYAYPVIVVTFGSFAMAMVLLNLYPLVRMLISYFLA